MAGMRWPGQFAGLAARMKLLLPARCYAVLLRPQCGGHATHPAAMTHSQVPAIGCHERLGGVASGRCLHSYTPTARHAFPPPGIRWASSSTSSGSSSSESESKSESTPRDLRQKWKLFYMKVIGAATSVLIGTALLVPVLQERVLARTRRRVLGLDVVTHMPPRTSSLTGNELVQVTGHFIIRDTMLLKATYRQREALTDNLNPLAQPVGFEVIVPFYCDQTKSIVLVNVGWLPSFEMQRYLINQDKILHANTPNEKVMFVAHRSGIFSDRFDCWDGKSRSVEELAGKSKAEPVLLDLVRGPFEGPGMPEPGLDLSSNFFTLKSLTRKIKGHPGQLAKCLEAEGALVARFEDLFLANVLGIVIVGTVLYVKRGFKFGGTFPAQYQALKQEESMLKAKSAANRTSRVPRLKP